MDNNDHNCPKCVTGLRDVKMQRNTYKGNWTGKNANGTLETGNNPIRSSHIYICPECGYMEIYADLKGAAN